MKQWDEFYQKRLDREWELYRGRNQMDEESSTQALEHAKQIYGFEEQRAGFGRDAALRPVEGPRSRPAFPATYDAGAG